MLTYGAVFAILSLSLKLQLLFAQSEPPHECGVPPVAAARQRDQGRALVQEGYAAKAVTLLKSAHELCPEDSETTRDLAEAEFAAGDFRSAETLVQGLLAKRNTPELHDLLGAVEAAMSDPKGAAAEYQIAATMDPSEQNLFDFGTSLMKVDYGAAGTVLAFGTKQFPNSVRLHVSLGLALYAQDRTEDGAEALCKAATLDPADEHPMEILSETGKIPPGLLPAAVQHLTQLHQRYPSNGLILFDLTMARSGRWSGEQSATTPEFVAGLQQAVSLDPHLSKAYVALADVYEEKKEYPQEIAALRQAIALAPEQAQTHYRLAFAYRQAGDQQHFREEIERFQLLHAKQLTAK